MKSESNLPFDPRTRLVGQAGGGAVTPPIQTDPTPLSVDPPPARTEYARRLKARRESLDRRTRLELRIADARLVVFTVGLVALALALAYRPTAWAWSLVPFAGFVGLVVVHERVRRATHRAARAADFYEKGLKRFDGSWPGTGLTGERFLDLEHPYAADLDLFGRGSLFERLCTARTRAGEETLADWLLAPADPRRFSRARRPSTS